MVNDVSSCHILLMRIFARSTIVAFGQKHPEAIVALNEWYTDFDKKSWESPNHIKSQYASASIIGNHRIVFNIKGNHYRLIASFNYRKQFVFIKFIGTHAEYDKIDALTVEDF